MSEFTDAYEIKRKITKDGFDFFFMSEGKYNIIKIIQYTYVKNFQGDDLYNLAFGDYDYRTGTYVDDLATNNGDAYSVYHTVLATIPYFFQAYENAMLMVQGSDSTQEYLENCRINCKRNCLSTTCKKAHRRINIYKNYLDKNLDSLSKDYEFWGGTGTHEDQVVAEAYVQRNKYLTIFIKKRKFIV